jgi:chemotaxis protein histidine kinase CheA
LLWKPFDARFEDFLSRLDAHKAVVNDEIQLATLQALVDAKKQQRDRSEQQENRKEEYNVKNLEQELEQRKRLIKRDDAPEKASKQGPEEAYEVKEKAEGRDRGTLGRLWFYRTMSSLENQSKDSRLIHIFQETILYRIKNWLCPPEFEAEFESACEMREEDTSEWLFREQKFLDWRTSERQTSPITPNEFGQSMLWINGQ